MMTKRDFEAVAEALAEVEPERSGRYSDPVRREAASLEWRATCQRVADACASLNPRFDRRRFLDACGAE